MENKSGKKLHIFSVETEKRFLVFVSDNKELSASQKRLIENEYGKILFIQNGSVGSLTEVIYI